jgi:predicted RNA-binding protein YlqC (UPF0109 family)
MVEDFIAYYTKLIVAYPDSILVKKNSVDEFFCEITVFAHKDDVGKLIGKSGNMINAIKTMVNGCKAKDKISYKIQVKNLEEV